MNEEYIEFLSKQLLEMRENCFKSRDTRKTSLYKNILILIADNLIEKN